MPLFVGYYWSLTCCSAIHRYPIFSARYSVMCKVYTGYCGTSEIEHGLCACTVDNPLAKARGLSLRTSAQTMLYLSLEHFFRRLVIIGWKRGDRLTFRFTCFALHVVFIVFFFQFGGVKVSKRYCFTVDNNTFIYFRYALRSLL